MSEPTVFDCLKLLCAGLQADGSCELSLDLDSLKLICAALQPDGSSDIRSEQEIDLRAVINAFGRRLETKACEEARARGLSFERYQIIERHLRGFYLRSTLMELQARIEIDDYTKAQLEAVRSVFPEVLKQYRAAELSGMHLWKAAACEMEKLCDSFGISGHARRVLYVEFVHPCVVDVIDGSPLVDCERPENAGDEQKRLVPDVDASSREGPALQSPIRKRGRPRPPDVLFDKALEEKAAGKRNKEVVNGLDNRSDSTSAQARGLSVRLKNYLRGRKKQDQKTSKN